MALSLLLIVVGTLLFQHLVQPGLGSRVPRILKERLPHILGSHVFIVLVPPPSALPSPILMAPSAVALGERRDVHRSFYGFLRAAVTGPESPHCHYPLSLSAATTPSTTTSTTATATATSTCQKRGGWGWGRVGPGLGLDEGVAVEESLLAEFAPQARLYCAWHV
jgi:hypothetical protein